MRFTNQQYEEFAFSPFWHEMKDSIRKRKELISRQILQIEPGFEHKVHAIKAKMEELDWFMGLAEQVYDNPDTSDEEDELNG